MIYINCIMDNLIGVKSVRKVALVTGSSRGIGREIVRQFAQVGYNVVVTYNKEKEKADQLAAEVESMGVECLTIQCNIANEEEVKTMVDAVINKWGHIEVLVNNAGIAIDSLFQDKTVDNFRKTLDVNLIGTFLVSKYVGEHMYQNKYGKIINIASTNGINTYYPMCLDYDASKAGIISLTHNLAIQFAPYVNVNAVAPGFIATESEISGMNEEFVAMEEEKVLVRRAGTEEDVANVVLFLASDKARFVNSEVIRVDGGVYGNY